MASRSEPIIFAGQIGRPRVFGLVALLVSLAVAGIITSHAQGGGDARNMKGNEASKIEKTLVPLGPLGGSVSVHVHIINTGPGIANGDVTDAQIADQIAVLNAGFASGGWSFTLASTDRTTNPTWFAMTPGSPAERAAKSALRQGSGKALNIYTAVPGSGSLGFASWPWDYASDPVLDGVVMLYSTMPGGTAVPYDLGATATHLVGHWMGLFHTFEGACQKNGDLVEDTPAEQSAAFGCPVARDSCAKDAGLDPTRNFMDFADDQCKDNFTSGQGDRMQRVFDTFRHP